MSLVTYPCFCYCIRSREYKEMPEQIKAVIFDIDGVLLDSLSIWKELGRRYITNLGYQPVPDMDEILFPMSMEQGAAWLKDTFSLEDSQETIMRELEKEIQFFYFEEVKAKSGAEELLQKLNKLGILAVAATSSPREHVRKALERNHLLSYLEAIYTTSEIGESKYSPKIYLTAAEFLKINPCEILVAEDSLYALATAKNAGFQTAGIFDPVGEPEQKQLKNMADIYCQSLKDLMDYIEQNDLTENGGK